MNKLFVLSLLISLAVTMLPPQEMDDIILQGSTTQEIRDKLKANITNSIKNSKTPHPANWDKYIKSYEPYYVDYVTDFVEISNIESSLKKQKFPQDLLKDMALLKFAKYSSLNKYNISYCLDNDYDHYKFEGYLGLGQTIENFAFYGMYYIKFRANAVPLYQTVEKTRTKHPWYCLGICKKTEKYTEEVRRCPNKNETEIIDKEMNAHAYEIIKSRIN